MTPFIAKLIERSCVTTHADCPLDDLIAILAERRIGTVVVIDRYQQVIGIVSERDIIRHLSTGGTTANTFAKNIMTSKVITVENNVTSAQLMQLITEHHIRHVPITCDGKLVGIVSIGDVVKRLLEKYEQEAELIKQFINS
ncbi:CBS domain-containing protein [Candidatus Puniceispirillum sp.]|nr:CBS domain-containing protein [bacterium]MDC0649410.1 CBS domain-containing protein [Alphaproteobacteria bacterium]MDC1293997.1 CBS domain-containing protein [Candidatus Puniceispirillum sp.]